MNPLSGSFQREDWERICHALECYYDKQYSVLSTQDATDREWTELQAYKHLCDDILYFIISQNDIKSEQNTDLIQDYWTGHR